MSVIDDIKDRIDIVDIVSETVKLKKSGRTYIGFCPFHANSRTPSFVVWPETGTWKCFGACNTGGDVFTYVMKRDGLEFKDALRELGHKAGIEIEERKPDAEIEDQHVTRLREAVATAVQWFNFLLNNNRAAQTAREHLAKRGITAKTIETFQLGYAPGEWNALEAHLTGKGFTREELIDAGLLVHHDDGRVFDRFRNRLMIPIHDGQGRPIGFGARALRDGDEPKYLNSPQSALFDKSRTLYGLHAARNTIRDQKVAVIVEGYMDALAAHQFGFSNVVASLGTALTDTQLKPLEKIAKRIVLALDPDAAGINAMMRGQEVARQALGHEEQPIFSLGKVLWYPGKLQTDLRILRLPQDQDPDEVMQKDPQLWTKLVDGAQPIVRFLIEMLSQGRDLNDPKEKAAFTDEILPIIRNIASPIEQDAYVQEIARLIKIEARTVLSLVRSTGTGPQRARRPAPTPAAESIQRDSTDLEQYCLSAILRSPYALKIIDDALERAELPALNSEDFEHAHNREVFRALRSALLETPGPDVAAIRAELDPSLHDHLAALMEQTTGQPALSRGDSLEQDAQQVGLRLRERRLRREGHELHALLEDAPNDSAPGSWEALYQARQSNATALLRLQQILTARTITRQSTFDPWSRA